MKISLEKKATIARYAAENGIVSALVHFVPELPDNNLKDSMACRWKNTYLLELIRKKKFGEDLNVKALATAKMG